MTGGNGQERDQHHVEPTENPHERSMAHRFGPDLLCDCGADYFEHQRSPALCPGLVALTTSRSQEDSARYGVPT